MISETLKPDIQQIVQQNQARASGDRSQLEGENMNISTYPPVRRTSRGEPWMVRNGGGQSCSCRRSVFIPRLEGKGVCRCFAGEKPNERRRRRREKEGGTLSAAGEAGRRKAHTHTHASSQAVCSGGMRKAKQRVRRSGKKKNAPLCQQVLKSQ